MNKKTSFKIFNSSDSEMEIVHEPEGFQFNLPVRQEILIETDACRETIQLKIFLSQGKFSISILDENSLYKVLNNGENIFSQYL